MNKQSNDKAMMELIFHFLGTEEKHRERPNSETKIERTYWASDWRKALKELSNIKLEGKNFVRSFWLYEGMTQAGPELCIDVVKVKKEKEKDEDSETA